MNDFTKEELQNIYRLLDYVCELYRENDATFELRDKVRGMVEKYCDHEWRCWDDQYNTRECMKCGVRQEGEI